MELAQYIDHTLLKPSVILPEIERLCEEAREYRFAAVCIPPPMVSKASPMLSGSGIAIATVIGFPFGYADMRAKIAEFESAIAEGADELDTVINLIDLKAGNWEKLEKEMMVLTSIAHEQGKKLKVIIESGILNEKEIIACCKLYGQLGVDYLKTSTGYAERGASVEAVVLMKKWLPPAVRIKASGGIRTADFAIELIRAGASRLGCSASVAIVAGVPAKK